MSLDKAGGDQDNVQSALEASCDALMMLQSMELPPDRDDGSPAQQHVSRATVSLRCAITELRLARGEDASVVGLGFVVRAGTDGLPRARPHRPHGP